MKGIGKMTRRMVMGNTDKKMEQYLKGTGSMINNMVRELRSGAILLSMKEIM